MRQVILLVKTLFPAACAILIFGLITWQLRALDRYIPLALPSWTQLPGILLMGAGAILAFVCFALFAAGGALSPGPGFPDPRVCIYAGPYRYVRNPMSEGLLATLFGLGLFERSVSILVFTLLMAGLLHLVVVFVEEPKLERRFGQSFLDYKSRVKRWIPSVSYIERRTVV